MESGEAGLAADLALIAGFFLMGMRFHLGANARGRNGLGVRGQGYRPQKQALEGRTDRSRAVFSDPS
jgi:hypothetical protein